MKTDLWEYKDPIIYVSTRVATRQFIFCLLSYPGFCGIISCLTWSSGAGRGFKRSLSDTDLVSDLVTAATVGSGHQCLCVVLIKIEIYALPAFMGLGHCGIAYSDLPPSLSRQAGREADIINGSFSSYPTSSTLSPRSLQTEDQTVINSLTAYSDPSDKAFSE